MHTVKTVEPIKSLLVQISHYFNYRSKELHLALKGSPT